MPAQCHLPIAACIISLEQRGKRSKHVHVIDLSHEEHRVGVGDNALDRAQQGNAPLRIRGQVSLFARTSGHKSAPSTALCAPYSSCDSWPSRCGSPLRLRCSSRCAAASWHSPTRSLKADPAASAARMPLKASKTAYGGSLPAIWRAECANLHVGGNLPEPDSCSDADPNS